MEFKLLTMVPSLIFLMLSCVDRSVFLTARSLYTGSTSNIEVTK